MRTRRTPAPHTSRPRATRLPGVVAALLAAPLALGTLAATALPAAAEPEPANPTISFSGATLTIGPSNPATITCPVDAEYPLVSAAWQTSSGGWGAATETLVEAHQVTYSAAVAFGRAGRTQVTPLCYYAEGRTRHVFLYVDVAPAAPVEVATTTVLTLGQSRVEPGQPLYAQTVTTTADGTATEGSVQFYLDGQPTGAPVPVDSLGRADALFPTLVAGERSVTASYLGANLFKPSSSEAKPVFAKSKPAILPSIPSSTQAPSTTLRASFASVPNFPVATGTVTFRYSEGAPLGTATIVDGLATLDLPDLAAGTYDVFVDYSGDENYGASTSPRTTMTVAPAVPQVPHKSPSEVTVEVPAQITGSRVEVKVSVAPGQQWSLMSAGRSVGTTGSVAVTLTKGGERQEVTLVDGVATAVFEKVAPGTYEVEALYSGDKYYDVSAGRAKTEVVAPVVVPPVVTPVPDLTGSTSTLPAGGKITLVARGFLPDETVSFSLHSDPVFLGTAVADADGVATLVVAIPADAPAGAHHVRATGQTSQRMAEIPVTVTAAASDATAPIVTVPVEAPAPAAPSAATPASAAAPVIVTATPLAATGAELGSSALLVSVLLGSGALLLAGRRRFTTPAR